MFEWIFACLFRLYPPRFREVYADEALWLIRERLRDEKGLLRKSRLCLDLTMDFAVGLPQAYRTVPSEAAAVSVFPNAEGIPLFHVLDERKTGLGPFLIGSGLSLTALYIFSFILSLPSPYHPYASGGPASPIEVVMRRLSLPTPASPAGNPEAEGGTSGARGVAFAQSQMPTSAASAMAARGMQKRQLAAGSPVRDASGNGGSSTGGKSQGSHSNPPRSPENGGKAVETFAAPPARGMQPNLEANVKVIAIGLGAGVRDGSRDSQSAAGQGRNSLSPGGAAAGCVLASPSHTAQPKPELLLFHPSGPLLSYEVATIKPLAPDVASSMVKLPPGGSLSPLTIRRYIMNAYGAAYPPQIVGGPDWLNKDAYEIRGKVPDELESALQKMTREERISKTRIMQQCLLADRFHLKAHFETRVLPVYELLPARSGLKLSEVPAPPETKPGDLPMRPRSGDPLPAGSSMTSLNGNGLLVLNAHAIKMQLLSRIIAGDIRERPIVDHTGFTGYFDITDLTWAPLSDASAANELDAPSIEGALKKKLGLSVVPARDPIEVLVIDSIERPTPN
jgi:uncharacterized protein (TIGR03435 family)